MTVKDPMIDSFRVRARIGLLNGGGRLSVDHGELVFEADRPTRAVSRFERITHTDRRVILAKGRLVLPWFDTSAFVHDDSRSDFAVTPISARKRLRASLQAAGFEVMEIATWFTVTGRRVLAMAERGANGEASAAPAAGGGGGGGAAYSSALAFVGERDLRR